jgi:flagellar export protein FliJ
MSQDRGVAAVARVRGVEEKSSRVLLEQALRVVKEYEVELHTREELIRATAPFHAGTAADFVHSCTALGYMAQSAQEAAQRLEASKLAAAEAHRTWLVHKTRLRAVELLLERRAQRRREERDRRERAELDDVASQNWQRRQEAGR